MILQNELQMFHMISEGGSVDSNFTDTLLTKQTNRPCTRNMIGISVAYSIEALIPTTWELAGKYIRKKEKEKERKGRSTDF